MRSEDRTAVLQFTAFAPLMAVRFGILYLRMRRAAVRAEKRFYQELVKGGLPEVEARCLAEEYGSAFSLRDFIKGSREAVWEWKRG
jgi:hypothetical protein